MAELVCGLPGSTISVQRGVRAAIPGQRT